MIVAFVLCGGALGCQTDPWQAAINFNAVVAATKP
jgi:hypothetical protein